ncbi:hypothetical protein EZV62_026459 [Acer yangbiense]|uniref:GH18 domain-containing protein n=1 Tax=Acer yangbiense TaxID=1000413 RepID=A0A5C7GRH3_9ROSI|nr:hypothetical protein EZV62_026459 [Acer yangbiense]
MLYEDSINGAFQQKYSFSHTLSINIHQLYVLPSMAAKTTTFFFLLFFSLNLQCSSSDNWIRAGYWHSGTALPVSEINSALFTHLMCAFARINSSTYHIFIDSNYEQSFSNFTYTVKRKNPSVTTLLSIFGARQDSEIFSSMINQSSSRQSFIESSIETARLYGFDGLNLAAVMPGNSTSMTNLGTLLEDWRVAVASESRNSGKSELLLVMTCYYFSATRLLSYLVESMKKSLDWVDVLAFDNYLPTRDNFTGPHSALYSSSSSSSWLNINNSVQEWLNRGFLATKLVLCMPYHGYAWKLVNINDNAVGAPASGPTITIDGSMGYKSIKAYIRDYGYGAASVYNGTFGVNFFTSGQTWINFESVEAIRAKVSFAKEKGLLGYSVFQLDNDDNWELSTAAKDQGGKDQKNERRGYVPPEYVRKGIYSMKYDVYSFGVLLLQIISGKRTACYYGPNDSLNLLEFAYKLWKDGEGLEFFDSSLDDSSSTWKLMRCMQVALLCVQENPADRPTMLEVYTLLKNETATITTPRKPAFSFSRDEDEESNKCTLKVKICSINDASITQLVPR